MKINKNENREFGITVKNSKNANDRSRLTVKGQQKNPDEAGLTITLNKNDHIGAHEGKTEALGPQNRVIFKALGSRKISIIMKMKQNHYRKQPQKLPQKIKIYVKIYTKKQISRISWNHDFFGKCLFLHWPPSATVCIFLHVFNWDYKFLRQLRPANNNGKTR